MSEAQRGVTGDGASSVQNLRDPVGRNVDLARQLSGTHIERFELFGQMFAGMEILDGHIDPSYFDAVTACSRVSRMNRVYGIPRAFARAFTAARSGLGTRMLICSSFFSNSKCAGLNCEKSGLERSWARNASACSSVFRRGTFFFISRFSISCYLPRVHMASGH